MQAVLQSLPDVKSVHKRITVGAVYTILGVVGNGYVIETDEDEPKCERLVVLQSRFSEVI